MVISHRFENGRRQVEIVFVQEGIRVLVLCDGHQDAPAQLGERLARLALRGFGENKGCEGEKSAQQIFRLVRVLTTCDTTHQTTQGKK